jgi:aminopeptidase N
MARMVTEGASPGPDWLDAMARCCATTALDPAFRALALRSPGEDDMAQTLHAAGIVPDPDRIHRARQRMAQVLARHLAADLPRLWETLAPPGPYTPDARASGQRALRNAVLGLMSRLDGGATATRAYAAAANMTDQTGALACLIEAGGGAAEIRAFARQWGHDRLVMDKWFALQILHAKPADAATTTARLTADPGFDWKNPNRFRAVIGALSA